MTTKLTIGNSAPPRTQPARLAVRNADDGPVWSVPRPPGALDPESARARMEAVQSCAGIATGLYEDGFLRMLRNEWPE
ncbi:hypothetical protein [Curtobacterium sp. Leaf261]|uniref:hypothetical protein n=1 Tax=Curtobacterium sp. Leaf261 TaxID=1736311 RepID=UPI0012E29D40|nr:hypothetical protein [Curtobacterium sp. Leaf261]